MNWQPIETAPTFTSDDTRAVLVWCPDELCMFTAWYDHDKKRWDYFGPFNKALEEKPTHWMKLPEPPSE